ncbi:hypothetical protein COT49_03450 [candidate division WWE3 bacterium CG08_land_8_20_14_0_20_40_13]|uniref:Triosephosphate isomerase n=1 Tax=candidate division WWE3 bacterium CG08_land_8_20_14_0_20_40_13 TaxID=1975084 RepID=A0A2H0XCZ8_UNCKA|nr:MAG: hypothetical protein COT49_03450 [candidate division WWE3 bacterium CG08_land_8_20_14_0_20_40_13]
MCSYLIANWKLNDSEVFCHDWIYNFGKFSPLFGVTVVVCPSFPFVPLISGSNLVLCGAQDVSKYKNGPHTGQVSAQELSNLVKYCIVGHSEARREFMETIENVRSKMENLFESGIVPILCFEDEDDLRFVSDLVGKCIVVFEPSENISDGGQYKEVNLDELKNKGIAIKEKIGQTVPLLYGGSVCLENARALKDLKVFNGVLVGKASLDPSEFYQIGNIWQEE